MFACWQMQTLWEFLPFANLIRWHIFGKLPNVFVRRFAENPVWEQLQYTFFLAPICLFFSTRHHARMDSSSHEKVICTCEEGNAEDCRLKKFSIHLFLFYTWTANTIISLKIFIQQAVQSQIKFWFKSWFEDSDSYTSDEASYIWS